MSYRHIPKATMMLIAGTRMTQSGAQVVELNSDTVPERLRVR